MARDPVQVAMVAALLKIGDVLEHTLHQHQMGHTKERWDLPDIGSDDTYVERAHEMIDSAGEHGDA